MAKKSLRQSAAAAVETVAVLEELDVAGAVALASDRGKNADMIKLIFSEQLEIRTFIGILSLIRYHHLPVKVLECDVEIPVAKETGLTKNFKIFNKMGSPIQTWAGAVGPSGLHVYRAG